MPAGTQDRPGQLAAGGAIRAAVVLVVWWLMSLFLPLTGVTPAGATVLRPVSLEELVDRADLIVVGECAAVRSTWLGDRIVTVATLDVAETVKGHHRDRVTLFLPGGVGPTGRFPIAQVVGGTPRIQAGEQAFAFLTEASGLAGFEVVAARQGLLPIVGQETGEPLVVTHGGASAPVPVVSLADDPLLSAPPSATGLALKAPDRLGLADSAMPRARGSLIPLRAMIEAVGQLSR